jgi:hypothetical protein
MALSYGAIVASSIRRLPIVNDRCQAGIMSQGDLARHAATYQRRGEWRGNG